MSQNENDHSLDQDPTDPTDKILAHGRDIGHRGAAWIIGPVLVGLLAVGLAMGGDQMAHLNAHLCQLHPYAPLLFMPAGFALLVYLGNRFFAGCQGSGIPQTIAATDAPSDVDVGYLLSWRIIVGKMLLTLGGLGLGASIGREGPTIQIGASVMHSFYGRGPFQPVESRRILILAGGAAGIAAAFNAPLAGIMFAIEELSKKHVFNANSSSLVTIIVSGLISLSILGNYTYFGTTQSYLSWNGSLSAILLCGLVGGIAGGVFSRLFVFISFNMPRPIAQVMKSRPILYAAGCGLIVAVIGVATHGLVFGSGYEPTRLSLENSVALPWYYGLAKMIATLISATSGIAAGIFAPSLSIGAGLGDNIVALLPNMADHSAIVLLVMAAYLAGVTRAPVTSFIISMEMTASNQMLLPLMAATVVASQLSKLINPEPLYHKLSEKFVVPPERYRSAVNVRTGRDTDEESVVKYSTEIKKYPEDEGSKKVKE